MPSQEVRDRWNAKNPEKVAARVIANNALRDGRLERKHRCEECGAGGRLEKHHPDYSKPLVVRWLCSICHGKERRKSSKVFPRPLP